MNEKQNIGSLFDRIAGDYDRFNHLSSMNIDRLWRRKAVRGLRPCEQVLDVAVGTGDLAIEMLRKQKAQHVDGIDLSLEMMRIGAHKAAACGLQDKLSFRVGSALELPYENNSYDAVTCGYGVRNFSDLDKGLLEFYRVLKPGGQLMILEFSYPKNKLVAWAYDLYFNHVMTALGSWMTKDKAAFRYFYSSVKGFIWGDEMKAHLEAVGFKTVEYRTLTFGISTIYCATK